MASSTGVKFWKPGKDTMNCTFKVKSLAQMTGWGALKVDQGGGMGLSCNFQFHALCDL